MQLIHMNVWLLGRSECNLLRDLIFAVSGINCLFCPCAQFSLWESNSIIDAIKSYKFIDKGSYLNNALNNAVFGK